MTGRSDRTLRGAATIVGVAVGQSVVAAWEPLSDGRQLVLFTPTDAGGSA